MSKEAEAVMNEDGMMEITLPDDLTETLRVMAEEKGITMEDMLSLILSEVMQDEIQKSIDSGEASEEDFISVVPVQVVNK